MAIAAPTAGNRIVTTDLAAFYNLLKGVTGSGETITLIYNAAGAVSFQPSSDPATGTELFQIKNNAGTVQMALSSDGKVYAADGTAALPGLTWEADKTMGVYRVSANVMGLTARALDALRITNPASAVNYLQASGSATLTPLTLTAAGTDTNISINLVPKGAGQLQSAGIPANAFDPTLYWKHLGSGAVNANATAVTGTGTVTVASDGMKVASGATANSAAHYFDAMDIASGFATTSFTKIKFGSFSVRPGNSITAGAVLFVGVRGTNSGAVVNFATDKHIGIKYDSASANWFGTVSNGAAESTLDLGVAVTLNADALLAFTYDGTTATFWVNGANKGTIATANCPTGAGSGFTTLSAYADNKASAVDKQIIVHTGTVCISAI